MRLDAQSTAIVLDSTADFPDAAAHHPSWRVVPLYVSFGAESYRDGVDITAQEFYERLPAAAELPTTSQPTPADFLAAYRELDGYERILSVQLSSRVSGTFRSAELAAEELGDGRVRVIDSETASSSITMLALAIQRRLDRGTSDEEIDALVDRYRAARGLLFTVDTLEFLARGGRIGRARGFAGEMLHVKPILSIVDGEVVPVKRVRGNQKAFQEFTAAFESATSGSPGLRVGIAHAAAPERAVQVEKMVRDRRPQATIETVTELGAVIGTHGGPGTVGFFWFADDE